MNPLLDSVTYNSSTMDCGGSCSRRPVGMTCESSRASNIDTGVAGVPDVCCSTCCCLNRCSNSTGNKTFSFLFKDPDGWHGMRTQATLQLLHPWPLHHMARPPSGLCKLALLAELNTSLTGPYPVTLEFPRPALVARELLLWCGVVVMGC